MILLHRSSATVHHQRARPARAGTSSPTRDVDVLTLSDNMSLTVESAASSTIGPCTGPVPMDGSSMACYLDRWKLRKHQSALDGRPSPKRSRPASCASSARPALKRSVTAWSGPVPVPSPRGNTAAEAMGWPRRPASRPSSATQGGAMNIVSQTLQSETFCPTHACTTSRASPERGARRDEPLRT